MATPTCVRRTNAAVCASFVWLALGCEASSTDPAAAELTAVAAAAAGRAGAQQDGSVTGLRVLSRDGRGRARMLLSSSRGAAAPRGLSAEAFVRRRLGELAPELGITDSALRQSVVERVHELPGGGSIMQLGQRAFGREVFQARASVTLSGSGDVVSVSSALAPDMGDSQQAQPFTLAPEAALAQLYTLRSQVVVSSGAVQPQLRATDVPAEADEALHYQIETPSGAQRVLEATARQVYFSGEEGLIPAYHVELLLRDSRGGNHGVGAVLDARVASDAAVLWSAELTANEAFSYRVWAESDALHTPTDGPLVDATPYPGGVPDRMRPGFRAPSLVSVEGFNHNPDGAADPWLSADATESLGNNVSAYTDRNQYTSRFGIPRRDGFDAGDMRATVTSPQTFDHVYDTTLAPDASDTQLKAAVTQVFYVTNWLHDYWYDSGFDEAAGNAQQDNYGRGGRSGDPLRAEAQDSADSGAANNANMSVLGDGTSPRMQMYVWSGLPVRSLVTEPPITFDDELGAASYGPQEFDATGELALVDDGSEEVTEDSSSQEGSVIDGCQAFDSVEGRIAVVQRGGCTFVDKVENAERAGAKALLIVDNAPGHSAVNPSVSDPPTVSIPVLTLSQEDGQKLLAALQASESPVQATRFFRGSETLRDGTIDNTVVAHEWGHYLHLRLVRCASLSCSGMSEGWGDFIALMLVVRDADDFDDQVYPLSQYASGGLNQSSGYFGTRRAPYSVDLSKNPFTFKHVRQSAELPSDVRLAPTAPEMNEVHNVGEIWAAMLFEAYVNVLQVGRAEGRSFEQSRRRMADYVVAGMKAAPVNPTFVEQRDAILASVQAMASDDDTRLSDYDAIAQGFAKRGLGVDAIAPPSDSTTLDEAVESFTAPSSGSSFVASREPSGAWSAH